MLEVVRQELALGVVAREAERRLGEVVRAEGAEVGDLGDLVGAHARARQLDHRAAAVLDRGLLGRDALGQLAQEPAQLLAEADERMHDLDERRLAGALLDRARRPGRSRAPASRRSPATAGRAGSRACRASGSPRAAARSAGASSSEVASSSDGRNSCSGGSSSRIVTGKPGHRLEDPLEVGLLHRAAACRARRAARPRRGARIISCTIGSRSWAMNMCSVRQRPMPSAPNSRALAASSGVSAFARTRRRRTLVGPAEDRAEVLVDRGRHEPHRRRRSPGRCRRRS